MATNIANEIADAIGTSKVTRDQGELEEHAYDFWPIALKWKQQGVAPCLPGVVVYPETTGDVSSVLRIANSRGVAVTPWGGGSSVTGSPLAVQDGIILDLRRMNKVIDVDEGNLFVHVEAGILGSELEEMLRQRGYSLMNSPQSIDRSTIGGWVATRATGHFSSRWGGMEDLVLSLKLVLPTGEIATLPLSPRASLGPDLKHLFLGSEGTLAVVTEVVVKMYALSSNHLYESLTFRDVPSGLQATRKIMQANLVPHLVRLYDGDESRHVLGVEDPPGSTLFLGFEGTEAIAAAELNAALSIASDAGGQSIGPDPVLRWLESRFDYSTIEKRLDEPGGIAETIEVADFWTEIGSTYRAMKENLAPLADEVLGHFSHVYPHGTSLYLIMLGRAPNAVDAEDRIAKIWETAMATALDQGASIAHHHGIGLARARYYSEAVGSSKKILEVIKGVLDPKGIMNPGKLTEAQQH